MTAALARIAALTASVVLGGFAGCGHPARGTVISASDPAEYPCVLADPRTLPHDFMVRQSVTIRARVTSLTARLA